MIRKSRKEKSSKEQHQQGSVFCTGLYLRLSDKDEGKNDTYSNSIDNQKNYLFNYLSDKPYLQVSEIYIDDGKTGSNYNRSGFQRMLNDIKVRKINCVIVKDLSRLGRNFYETGSILEMVFPFYGVRFIAVSDNFDSMDAGFTDLSFNMPVTNFINETYVVDTSKKIRSARRSMAQRGRIPYGNVAYGYQKSAGDKYKLEINEEAAEVVKLIYNWFEKGKSKTSIVRALNEKGVLSPSQYKRQRGLSTPYPENSIWTDSAIRTILKNPIYAGTAVFGRTKPVKPRGKNVLVPKENWILNEDIYPAIIPKEQFLKVQKLQEKSREDFQKDSLPKQKTLKENNFQGIIYCKECKGRMKRHRVKKKNGDINYFECRNYLNGGSCSKKYLNEDKLKEALNQYVKKYNQMVGKQEKWQEVQKRDISNSSRQKVLKTANHLSVMYQHYHEGKLNRQTFLILKEKYIADKKILERRDEEKDIENLNNISKWNREKEVLHELVERIEISEEGRISIEFCFMDLIYLLT